MEYVYCAMLLHKAGKEVNEANVKKVLDAAGVQADDGKIKALIAALDGVNIDEAIKEAAVAAPVAAPAASSAGEKKEEKKEEPKAEKKSTEEAAAGLGALFG
ncbi:50S ribosomal protein P1 [archaeon]|jgi:large subunit ribosomal protein L12|nr:50S ribosomal protein P1 [archaeon]MBT4416734.1 50S ribosomal protein P1 [archaeon]